MGATLNGLRKYCGASVVLLAFVQLNDARVTEPEAPRRGWAASQSASMPFAAGTPTPETCTAEALLGLLGLYARQARESRHEHTGRWVPRMSPAVLRSLWDVRSDRSRRRAVATVVKLTTLATVRTRVPPFAGVNNGF